MAAAALEPDRHPGQRRDHNRSRFLVVTDPGCTVVVRSSVDGIVVSIAGEFDIAATTEVICDRSSPCRHRHRRRPRRRDVHGLIRAAVPPRPPGRGSRRGPAVASRQGLPCRRSPVRARVGSATPLVADSQTACRVRLAAAHRSAFVDHGDQQLVQVLIGIRHTCLCDAHDGEANGGRRAEPAEPGDRHVDTAREPAGPQGRVRGAVHRPPARGAEAIGRASLEGGQHPVGGEHRHGEGVLAFTGRDRQRRRRAAQGDPDVGTRIVRRQADHRRDQLDEPRPVGRRT